MKINYNVSGQERKKLVKLISEITEVPSKYLGVPSCAYQVGSYNIGKDGELNYDSEVAPEDIKSLMQHLSDAGFEAEVKEPAPAAAEPEETGLIIQIPKDSLSDEDLEKLKKLIGAKGNLIAIVLIISGILFDIPIIFGLLYIFWAIQDIKTGEAYIVENILKKDNLFLFWIIVLLWMMSGLYLVLNTIITRFI